MNTHSELLVNHEIYAKPFPNFGKPKIIGYIGLENLKYARKVSNGKVKFDLNLLCKEAKKKPADLDVKLNDLINFLLNNEHRLNLANPNNFDSASFYCYRGLLTCIACTPYENREPWKIVAILYKGNIYLCARDTEEKKLRQRNMTEKDKLFTSWGYKFEQYMLSDKPHSEPNPHVPVDETEEFSLVFTTHLHKHKIIYGAEMDGIRCDKSNIEEAPKSVEQALPYLLDKEFIELKTSRHIEFANQDRNFRKFKLKKWWCQSFLVGIDTILCGFRNDHGFVEELKVFNVHNIPKMCSKFWDPSVCFNFLDTFLVYVKRCLSREVRRKYGDKSVNNLQDLPLTCLLFEWTPGTPVHVSDDYNHDDDPILPQWFLTNYGRTKER